MGVGTPKQRMRALFGHSVVLAGDHLGHDDVIGAIEEVTAIYGHSAPFVARHHPDKRRVPMERSGFPAQDAPFPR